MPRRRHSQLPFDQLDEQILRQEEVVRQQTDDAVKERELQELLALHAQRPSRDGRAARQIRELQTRIEFCSQETVRTALTEQMNILQARLERKRESARARMARFRARQPSSEDLPPQARSEEYIRRRNEVRLQQRQAETERLAGLESRNDLSIMERAELAHLVGARIRRAIDRRQRLLKQAQKRLSLLPAEELNVPAP